MGKALIIGCGGVASVAIAKCCQNSEVFTEIMIASRTLSKCDALKEKLQPTTKTIIHTRKVDADTVPELVAIMEEFKPDVCLNLALPYQDLTIMDAIPCQRYQETKRIFSSSIAYTKNPLKSFPKPLPTFHLPKTHILVQRFGQRVLTMKSTNG